MIWILLGSELGFFFILLGIMPNVFGWLDVQKAHNARYPFNWRIFLGPKRYFYWLEALMKPKIQS